METRGGLWPEHLEGDGAEAANIDDEEVEELHNSLKEVVQDPFVKPKLQCLMVDPSFSMVTVQSEDSGIVWETASSRCSTPWASEASSPSDVYSLESSGTQGNIVIIMDEDKIKRRKKTSKGDRFRRRLSGAAIGEERPAMVEVSVPNVRPENSEDGQSAEAKTDKDQELFNLISEGFEILNIVVPSKLPTVDEEDSTELTDNLSYLEDSPKIKSKCKQTEIAETEVSSEDATTEGQETDEGQKVLSQESADQSKKEESDLDYLEKFTLLDETAPCEIPEKPEPEKQVAQAEEPQPQVPQEKEKVEEKLDEESFVIISDVEIASEHLDEVFYGAKCHEEPEILSHRKEDGKHLERQSSKSLKECGATLFGSQECILTPVYLPSGPPKIIDQNLLDEPRALSYHYSDLYEDAVGDRKREDDFSDVESVISEKSFKRRFSESDDDGYLEKFTLKDHTEAIEDTPDEDISDSDRMIWPQNKFEMTGCLIRVEPKEEEVPDSQSKLEGKQEDVKVQIQPPDSSKDCEPCGDLKTGCARVEKVPEASEDCEDCGTETGCPVAKIITPGQHFQKVETNKAVFVKAEVKYERSHVPQSVVQETKVKEETNKEALPIPEKSVKRDITNKAKDVTDCTVEIEETIIIKKEKVSGKGHQHKKTQESAKPDLVAKTDEKVLILPKPQKQLPAVEKEVPVKALEPEKKEMDKTKPSDEKVLILPQKEVPQKKVPPKEIPQKEHPVVDKGVHVKAPVPEVEKTKPSEEKMIILPQTEVLEKEHPLVEKDVHVKASVPEKTEVEKTKPSEEKMIILPQTEVREKEHPVVEKDIHVKAPVPEITKVEQTKPLDEKVLILPQKEVPEKEHPIVKKEVLVKALVPEITKVEQAKPLDEKVLILPQKEVPEKEHPIVEKEVLAKALVPEKREVDKTKPSEENVIILPKKEVLEKEHPVLEKEVSVVALAPEKIEVEKTKPSNEKGLILPKKECPVVEKEVPAKALVTEKTEVEKTQLSDKKAIGLERKCETEVIEKSEVTLPARVKEKVIVDSEKQKTVADKTIVPEVDLGSVEAKSEATDNEVRRELETISEPKASEKALASKTEMAENKMVEIKEKVEEIESMEGKIPTIDSKVPDDHESVTVIHSQNDVTQDEKDVLVKEQRKTEADVSLKHELHKDKSHEKREVDEEVVSIDVLPQEIPAALLPTVAEKVPKAPDLLPAVIVMPPVLDEEVGKKDEKLADAVTKETLVKTERDANKPVAHIPDVEAKMKVSTKAASVSTPVPCEIEVVHKETKSEIKEDVAVDLTRKEGTGQVPELVLHAAPTEVKVDASKLAEQKTNESTTEIKSKKVLLKDTHKENIWRTLEPITPSPPVEMQDSSTMRVSPLEDEEFVENGKLKRGTGLFSTLRSFTPHEDLSGFGCDTAELDLSKEIIEEPDYEMVSKQEARQSESEAIAGTEHLKPDVLVQDKSAEETLEESYDFIEELDGAQESELGRLIEDIEIQPMDAFCLVCRCPILMSDAGHQNHEVSSLDKAFEDIKSQLSNWISVLQEKAENIEDMVSELELAYNSVEEHCKDSEKAVDEQNEEVLKLVMDQYNEMSQAMEDEKKVKLEQLYDQIVSFQSNIDTAKETMEQTAKEMEETDDLAFASSYKEIDMRLKTALESTMSLELGPRGLLVFEDYAKGTTANEKKNRQVIPVPQQPRLQPQEANSATSTSVTVYWTINEGDIIDCFQVYCMEEPQGAVSEEYRVTVKESYCNLEELEPDKCYKVWVMAVNYTGCSLPSERLPFRTAPSVPVINPEACTVLWDSATLRWSSAQPSAVDSFTLEYCRQYAMEGEGLRSISGIKGYEQKVLLQPNENFLFYIKSVNAAGASEQSEAALISTRGSRFHLLTETANAVLKVFEDRNSVEYPQETYNQMSTLIECPAVMGELLPRVGYHYWETVVADCRAYRIGVAYQTAPQDSAVGDNSASWCLHCVPTSISCRFELLHDKVESDIFVMDVPRSIGTLLDFTQGRLVFFNAQNGQCLGSFQQSFRQPCHPVFVLETAGRLELKMTMEVPEFAKHW
ncbi:cardiomyopathy-associated protein 5 [Astyanax mexicanus]|uniref:Cardiomyopathy associated 5 n=1 Tax=Astyanax mexicanus TaxID=7994 RepID=A0A8B9H1P2_ASTMX|nr:cardiomyopathy-associated protein 5 [Astyanax mexicanus]